MRATDPNNPNNNNRFRTIVSTVVGVTTGTIAAITTDRITGRNQQNNQTPGTTEQYATRTTGIVSDYMLGAERTVNRTTLPQEAFVHLKRKATQTNKEVEASAFSPASRETQTTYEEEAKFHFPVSGSAAATGTVIGSLLGTATYILLGDDNSKPEALTASNADNSLGNQEQEVTALFQLSEEERCTFQQFRQPDPGRLSPVSRLQCEHYKKIHDTTRDKNELLEMKFKLHDLARRNTPDDESVD
jgi:hypothetical protein